MSVTQLPPHVVLAKGYNGQAQFDGTYVTITRNGFLARSTVGRGDKRIPLSAIVSVKWKPATSLFAGFIQFETASVGGTRSKFGRQTFDAVEDENSVVFRKGSLDDFERLRAAVEQALERHHNGQATAAAPVSVADELAKLAGLRDQGVLSPAEFEQQKARVLGV